MKAIFMNFPNLAFFFEVFLFFDVFCFSDLIFLFLFFIYDKIRRIREITELRPDIRSHLIKERPNAFNILSSLDFMLW